MSKFGTFENKRIGVLGKGGSGKSTITALMAHAFTNRGFEVCVLDADSTNVGLHTALGFEESPASLIEYFGGTDFAGGSVSCPVDDPTPLPGAEIDLRKFPHRYYSEDDGLFLFVAGKIGDKGPGAGCDGPISKITRDLRVNGVGDRCVTLIDVKAGLEDAARGIITSMDWIILVVDPNMASIQLAEDTGKLIRGIKAGHLPATEHLDDPGLVEKANRIYREARTRESFVILNKIKSEMIESHLRKELEKRGIEPIGTVHEDLSVSSSWLEGTSVEGTNAKQDIEHAVKRLTERFDQ